MAEEALVSTKMLDALQYTPNGPPGIFALYLLPGQTLGRVFLNEWVSVSSCFPPYPREENLTAACDSVCSSLSSFGHHSTPPTLSFPLPWGRFWSASHSMCNGLACHRVSGAHPTLALLSSGDTLRPEVRSHITLTNHHIFTPPVSRIKHG